MMREAYRLEKSIEVPGAGVQHEGSAPGQLCIAFLYTGRKKTFPNLDAFREEISRLLHNMSLS